MLPAMVVVLSFGVAGIVVGISLSAQRDWWAKREVCPFVWDLFCLKTHHGVGVKLLLLGPTYLYTHDVFFFNVYVSAWFSERLVFLRAAIRTHIGFR